MALRPTLIAVSVAAAFSFASPASANPSGPNVVSGSASFASAGSMLSVTNSANAVIQWQGFSIGVNEITRFLQPSAASAVLNRVVGGDLSSILGALESNGRVFLINPNGIVFGAGARIDVAGLVASSLNLSDQDFLNGRLRFAEVPGAGGVANHGVINTAAGGSVYLVAPSVENSGIIRAPHGEIVLAAGSSAELISDASPYVSVRVSADAERALNVGSLIADSGRIGMFGALVRHSGVAQASGAEVGAGGEIRFVATKDLGVEAGSRIAANGTSGGEVLLQAEGGTNLIAGTVEATGAQGRGGTVQALGVRVGVIGQGVIDASGETGGGSVLVGGDFQGANATVQNAERTLIGADGVIRADARTTGDGGRVIAWADGDTRFYGSISAKGGAQAGDGGFAEVSGRQHLDYRGRADLTAAAGSTGTLLLDPQDITIVSGGSASNPDITETAGPPFTFASNSSVSGGTTLTDGTINAALSSANVLVKTGGAAASPGDIKFDSADGAAEVFLTGAYGHNLTFDATRSIFFTRGTTRVALNFGAPPIPATLTLRAGSGSITSATETDGLSLNGDTGLLMIAGSGIGSSAIPLQLSGVTALAATTASNGIYISAGGFAPVNITALSSGDLVGGTTSAPGLKTTNAAIFLEAINDDGGGSISLDAPVNSGTARTTLRADEQIYSYYGGGSSIVAGELVMSATNGIGCGQCFDFVRGSAPRLQTQVGSLQATNQFNGVELDNTGNLTLGNLGAGYAIDNPGGSAIISSTGNITVAAPVNVGRRFSLTADGSLFINADVTGGPAGGERNNASELIADADRNGSGIITQNATSTVSTNSSDLDIAIACPFGCDLGSEGGSGQNITLGVVDAGSAGMRIRNEHGGISTNSNGLLTAADLVLRAEQGINLDTAVSRLSVRHALKGGTGAVVIRNASDGGTLALEGFFFFRGAAIENGNGAITVTNDGSIQVGGDVHSGSARTTLSAGDEIIAYGGTIIAGELVLSAVNGIGRGGDRGNPLQTQVSSLQATNTDRGVEIQNSGDLTIRSLGAGYGVRNTNGAVIIAGDGNITVSDSVTAGRRVSLIASGDLQLNASLSAQPPGGEINFLGVELIADGDNDGAGSILGGAGITSNGGNVYISGVGVAVGGINTRSASSGSGGVSVNATNGDIVTGTIATNSLSPSFSGGGVALNSSGGVVVNGGIDTRGANGDAAAGSSSGFWGGNVNLSGTSVQVNGSIIAVGGNAATGASGYGGSGGWGGAVTIGGGSGSSIHVTGNIVTRGGSGGASTFPQATGGDGGKGGAVLLANQSATVGGVPVPGFFAFVIDTAGGNGGTGGPGASPGGNGGPGGNAGDVVVDSAAIAINGIIVANGGAGGSGGAGSGGSLAGNAGAGGSGGSLNLSAFARTGAITFVNGGWSLLGGAGGTSSSNGVVNVSGVTLPAGCTATQCIWIGPGDASFTAAGSGTFLFVALTDPLSNPEVLRSVGSTIEQAAKTASSGESGGEEGESERERRGFGSCRPAAT